MDTITLVTDGACSGNPGPGGWCVIVRKENEIKEFFAVRRPSKVPVSYTHLTLPTKLTV